ncbi:uncharacterized protein [Haliotis asinina]|uniref:uncharacterized protein isoform X1 n=1 Tax=Haliotis asinina TaxID=109174 RepID=UPI003531E9F3
MAACRIALLIGFAWAIALQVDGQAVHYSERKASRQPVPYNSVFHAETGSSHGSPSHEPTVITLPPSDPTPTRQPVPYGSSRTDSNAFPDEKPHRQPVPRTDTKLKQPQRGTYHQGNHTYATSVGYEARFNEGRPSRQPVPSPESINNTPDTKTRFVHAHNQIFKTPQSPSAPLWKKAQETPWQPGIGGYQPYYFNFNSKPNTHLNWNPVMDFAHHYQVKHQRYNPRYGNGNPLSNWVLSGRRASTSYNMYGQMVPTDSYKGNTYEGHLNPFGIVDHNGPCRRLCTMYCSLGYDVNVKGCPTCSCQRPGFGHQRYFGDAD